MTKGAKHPPVRRHRTNLLMASCVYYLPNTHNTPYCHNKKDPNKMSPLLPAAMKYTYLVLSCTHTVKCKYEWNGTVSVASTLVNHILLLCSMSPTSPMGQELMRDNIGQPQTCLFFPCNSIYLISLKFECPTFLPFLQRIGIVLHYLFSH
jgi:hypothetical protein